jgi:hypothetical protein
VLLLLALLLLLLRLVVIFHHLFETTPRRGLQVDGGIVVVVFRAWRRNRGRCRRVHDYFAVSLLYREACIGRSMLRAIQSRTRLLRNAVCPRRVTQQG